MSGVGEGLEFIHREADGVAVYLDGKVYRLSAVKKAAYKFGDRCHVHLTAEDSRTKVILKARKKLENVDHLAGEFCNEVLDQELREVVADETSNIRDLLIAQAFSKTSLIQPQFESEDFRQDSAEIHIPDNESKVPS